MHPKTTSERDGIFASKVHFSISKADLKQETEREQTAYKKTRDEREKTSYKAIKSKYNINQRTF